MHLLVSCSMADYTALIGMTYSGSRWAHQQLGGSYWTRPWTKCLLLQNLSCSVKREAAVLTEWTKVHFMKPAMSGFSLNVKKTVNRSWIKIIIVSWGKLHPHMISSSVSLLALIYLAHSSKQDYECTKLGGIFKAELIWSLVRFNQGSSRLLSWLWGPPLNMEYSLGMLLIGYLSSKSAQRLCGF